MAKYRKKPVVIEAVQYRPGETDEELMLHLDGCIGWQMEELAIAIPTLEGKMFASVGDWIIKGVQGEFYPCKPDIFEQTYEKVDVDG
jgi:hypothetical protein